MTETSKEGVPSLYMARIVIETPNPLIYKENAYEG